MSAGNQPAPRILTFMASYRMVAVRADFVAWIEDVGNSKTTVHFNCEGRSFPLIVDCDLSEVARKIWGDAWSAGAASEGARESEELVHDAALDRAAADAPR